MKILGITQTRYNSTRFPGKILKEISGKSLLEIHLDRIRDVPLISDFYVAIAEEEESGAIEEIVKKNGVDFIIGPVNNVLSRFKLAVDQESPDIILRFTSDCPLVDPKLISNMLDKFLELKVDYLSNTLNPSFPDGMDVEIFTAEAFYKADSLATLDSDREHVTPYIWRNSSYFSKDTFNSYSYENEIDFSDYRLTIDEVEDFEMLKILIEKLGTDLDWKTYVNFLNLNPEVRNLNNKYLRNEGFEKSLRGDNDN